MGLYNVPVGKPANEHETAPRRNARTAKAAYERPPGLTCNTVYELLQQCFARASKRQAMGWRDVVDIHEEKKMVTKKIDGKDVKQEKTWLYYELSQYKYMNYAELGEVMENIGRGLVKIGLKPNSEDKLHIFASTSHKWMKMFCGAQSQGIPIVTAYDTLGESGLTHSIIQTNSTAIFTDNSLLKSLINPMKKDTQNIKYIIHFEPINPKDKRQGGKMYENAHKAVEEIKKIRPDIKFFSFEDIIKLGEKAKGEIKPHPPKKEDLSCIMYTSGSTGDPKGVVLTHANIVAGVGGASLTIDRCWTKVDRIICFLPLAHIFELAFELLSFLFGSCIGYANVKTLTPASVRKCNGDLVEFKPTIMVGVAAVWETVRKGILAQINNLPYIKQKAFWAVYEAKLRMKRNHIPGGDFIGNLVFQKIREATGGRLRYLLNGGSPISRDGQEFISTVICPMLIGYGLTETVANTCILDPDHFEYGVCGDLTGAVTVKLVDVPDLGYFAKNNQGEIWTKGACVTTEYYKNPEETKATITEDGWFKTGDIGEWTDKGFLKIIDRKKNLVKTLNGEYIALEKLESVYRSNQYVQNVCVYADETKVKPVGIIVPNLKPLASLAESLGIIKKGEHDDIENHIHDKRLQQAVLSGILKTAKDQGLNGIELVAGIVFVDEEWTPQNGFVTSAQKLKRREILKDVKSEVDNVYANC